jgi:hypothetical protein
VVASHSDYSARRLTSSLDTTPIFVPTFFTICHTNQPMPARRAGNGWQHVFGVHRSQFDVLRSSLVCWPVGAIDEAGLSIAKDFRRGGAMFAA